jgi:hypothetical protein
MLQVGCFLGCPETALTLGVASGFRDPFVLDPARAGAVKAHKLMLSKSIPLLGISDHAGKSI